MHLIRGIPETNIQCQWVKNSSKISLLISRYHIVSYAIFFIEFAECESKDGELFFSDVFIFPSFLESLGRWNFTKGPVHVTGWPWTLPRLVAGWNVKLYSDSFLFFCCCMRKFHSFIFLLEIEIMISLKNFTELATLWQL